MTHTEGDLQFNFRGATNVFLPEKDIAGSLPYWQSVDFIVEDSSHYWFIEVKDPDVPHASNPVEFLNKLKSGQLQKDLALKYRHTFLAEWATGRVNKPVKYIVLLSMAALKPAELLAQDENLKRSLPTSKLDVWKKPIVNDCAILNLETWNKHLSKWPVTRISASQP